MKSKLQNNEDLMLSDIRLIISQTKEKVSIVLASNLTAMYWKLGNRNPTEILLEKRAEYGKQIVATLWRQLSWSHFKVLIPVKTK